MYHPLIFRAFIDQGNLYSMGWGADGQLGLGPESSSDRAVPTLIERLSWKGRGKELGHIKEISSSTDFTLALLENHQLWIWGNAEYGQCMVNKKIDRVRNHTFHTTKRPSHERNWISDTYADVQLI